MEAHLNSFCKVAIQITSKLKLSFLKSELHMELSKMGCIPKLVDFLRINDDDELLEITGRNNTITLKQNWCSYESMSKNKDKKIHIYVSIYDSPSNLRDVKLHLKTQIGKKNLLIDDNDYITDGIKYNR